MKTFKLKTLLLTLLMAVGVQTGWAVSNADGTSQEINATSVHLDTYKFAYVYQNSGCTQMCKTSYEMIQYCYKGSHFEVRMNIKYKGDYRLTFKTAYMNGTGTDAIAWYDENNSGARANASFTIDGSSTTTLSLGSTSSWTPSESHYIDMSGLTPGQMHVNFSPSTDCGGNFSDYYMNKTAGYVTYNYNDGVTDAKESKQTVGSAYILPTNPTREGYTFLGWFTAAKGGDKITSSTVFNRVDNPTLYAHWSHVDINAVETAIGIYDLAVSASNMYDNNNGPNIGCFWPNCYFTINANVKYKGDYKLDFVSSLETSGSTGKISLSVGAPEGSTAADGAKPTASSPAYVEVAKTTDWKTYSNSHSVALTGIGEGEMYVKVAWAQGNNGTASNSSCGNFKDFKMIKTAGYVSFNLNGGICSASTDERKITLGNEYGELPTPTRAGYSFEGWYNGETLASATDKLTGVENVELTAKWTPAITDASGNVVSKEEWIAKQNTTPNDIAFAGKDADVEGANNVFVEQEEKDENEQPIYKAANLVVTDGTAFSMPEALSGKTCKAAKATYTRTTSSNWGTICLPYAVESDDYVQYYELSKVDTQKGVMSFTAVDNVDANTPAVFCKKQSADAITPTNTDVPIVTTGEETSEKGSWKLIGTLSGDKIQKTEFSKYYIAQDKFWNATQASGEITIPAYRAYFQYTGNGAKVSSFTIAISDGDSTTAIGTIDANGEVQITGVYPELSRRGKYMQDGKVTIVKNGKKYNTTGQTIK